MEVSWLMTDIDAKRFEDPDDQEQYDRRTARSKGREYAGRFGLRDPVGIALAYKRLGYSASGIARMMDRSESTVNGYLETCIGEFGGMGRETMTNQFDPRGEAALWAYHANQSEDPLSPGETKRREKQRRETQSEDSEADELDSPETDETYTDVLGQLEDDYE